MQFCKLTVFAAAACGLLLGPSVAYLQGQQPQKQGSSDTTLSVPAPPPASPQKKDANGQPQFRTEVNEVIVPVTVTDEKGRFVSDLTEKDFQVFEDNKQQQIQFFTREHNQPVVIGFLVDLSTSSTIHWKNYQDAMTELIENLLKGDELHSGYLIPYSETAQVAVDTTNDPEALVSKIRRLHTGGGSALFDAIYLACTSRKLVHGEPVEPRRVIVILGDGHDNASKHSLDQVIELAQRNLVTIYCISTEAFGFTSASTDNLIKMVHETGGRVVYPLGDVYKDTDGYLSHPSDWGNYSLTVGTGSYKSAVDGKMYHAVADIAGEVTTQYIIRYVSNADSDRPFRNLKVIVDLANVKVRARRGYYSQSISAAATAASPGN